MALRRITRVDDRPTFDLQSHSTHSDGTLPPSEVVARAAAAGVELLALTDHDTVAGVSEAIDAGVTNGIEVLPAVEITAVDTEHEDIHLLGYSMNHLDTTFEGRLAGARREREQRGLAMVELLEDAGWAVDRAGLEAVIAAGTTVGRPHVGDAVFSHPDNAQLLAKRGLSSSGAVIGALLTPGGEGWVEREHPTVEEAIGWVHDAGGIAVWAHPFFPPKRYGQADVEAALRRYVEFGLDGVEAFYITHTAAETRFLHGLADELGLLTTGSADFHGPGHEHFSEFRSFELHGLDARLGQLAGG